MQTFQCVLVSSMAKELLFKINDKNVIFCFSCCSQPTPSHGFFYDYMLSSNTFYCTLQELKKSILISDGNC